VTVITEDSLRRKLLKKELQENMDLVLPKDSLLTPAAKSYLREHSIHGVLSSQEEAYYTDLSSISTPQEANFSLQIVYEIEHLSNLLYFPELKNNVFTDTDWLYFESQQAWLEKMIQGQFLDIEKNANCKEIYIDNSEQRQWMYSLKEIQTQLDKIKFLFKEKNCKEYQHFQKWATEFLNVIDKMKYRNNN
jgi:hypothetical protein